jgi:hypothetical protein
MKTYQKVLGAFAAAIILVVTGLWIGTSLPRQQATAGGNVQTSSAETSTYQPAPELETTTTQLWEDKPIPPPAVSVLTEEIEVTWTEDYSIDDPCIVTFNGSTQLCVGAYITVSRDEMEAPISANIQLSLDGVGGCSDYSDCLALVSSTGDCQQFLTSLSDVSRDLVATPAYNDYGVRIPLDLPITYWDGNSENRRISFGDDCSVTTEQL